MKKYIITIITILFIGATAMADPKSEVEDLMNDRLPFGQELLEKYGEFFPYGGAITSDGKIVSVAAYDGDEQPPSMDVINLLKNGFRQAAKKGEYKATALFYDVRVIPPGAKEKVDAIAIALDHKENYSVVVFFTYTLINSKLEFGEVFAEAGANDIFNN